MTRETWERAASIKARLVARGFTLADSPYLGGCKDVTGPAGELYGPMTANECAARFLDGEDLAPLSALSSSAPGSDSPAAIAELTDVEGAARDAEHARRPRPSRQ